MSKNKKRRGLLGVKLSFRTRVIIAAAAAVVIILGGTIIYFVIAINQTKPLTVATKAMTPEQRHQATIQQEQELANIITDAQTAMEHGDSAKVDSIYQSQIANTKDVVTKQKLILDQSRVYYFGSRYDKAIQIAKSAEGLTDDKFLVANWLSQVYMGTKHYGLAVQYYTLTGKWVSSPNNEGGFTKEYYDQKAIEAQAQAKVNR
jgi:hypothetical protein